MTLLYGLMVALATSIASCIAAFVVIKQLKSKIKTLEGTLEEQKTMPNTVVMCASCKGVRAQQWQALESYLKTHTTTNISHTICPNCMKTLYPELSEPQTEKL